jgi:hypothetical protein
MLFDDIPRHDLNVPDQHETAYGYLNRSGRPVAARVRQSIEDWLSRYPAHDRDALIARLRSSIDDQHLGAFFELFIHELLLVRGHRIIEVEPKLQHTPRSPDFLVQVKGGGRLYLECVLATGRSQADVSAQARLEPSVVRDRPHAIPPPFSGSVGPRRPGRSDLDQVDDPRSEGMDRRPAG